MTEGPAAPGECERCGAATAETTLSGDWLCERVIRRWAEIEAQGAIPDDPTTWACPDCGEQLATDAEQGVRCLACGTGFVDDADPSMEADR